MATDVVRVRGGLCYVVGWLVSSCTRYAAGQSGAVIHWKMLLGLLFVLSHSASAYLPGEGPTRKPAFPFGSGTPKGSSLREQSVGFIPGSGSPSSHRYFPRPFKKRPKTTCLDSCVTQNQPCIAQYGRGTSCTSSFAIAKPQRAKVLQAPENGLGGNNQSWHINLHADDCHLREWAGAALALTCVGGVHDVLSAAEPTPDPTS